MGVTGLWTVIQPCARPIKIETLNRKRLAVDASIWIYQFLKAVRDKEGNALRNSHVVGFFRRICKLLFLGIKPIFVFDGGAPALKRQTINSRKQRREGRREDAVRTAGRLLAVQMQRRAEEEEKRRKEAPNERHDEDEEEPLPENLVYVEEIGMTQQERQQNRKFRKKDAYHLPDLDVSLSEMGAPNDPRIMSLEELEQYARNFEQGEDISVYDFSKIDFDSPFFMSLPDADRYNILNAARLRSRLRMGYSKDQLDTMFPDRMAFSKFQIDRVKERNELTQRLMNLNGMNEQGMAGVNGSSRVAGEKGREYVLVKNDGVEGGWALGVVSSKDEGERNKPIDVDELDKPIPVDDEEDSEDEEDFEDVPIEGLNRLPKQRAPQAAARSDIQNPIAEEPSKRRAELYKSRNQNRPNLPTTQGRGARAADPDSLFVAEDSDREGSEDGEPDFTDAPPITDSHAYNEEDELQRAIAMSLQQEQGPAANSDQSHDEDDYGEVFQQQKVDEAAPFTRGSGSAIARMANARSTKAAAEPATVSDDEDEIDFQAALAKSKRLKQEAGPPPEAKKPIPVNKNAPSSKPQNFPGFDGPLPFEKLNLGTSLLGKKKMQQLEEDKAGGFEKSDAGPAKKNAEPLPPWFEGKLDNDMAASKAREDEEKQREMNELPPNFQFQQRPIPRKQETREVIDLDAPDISAKEPISIESSDNDEDDKFEDAQMADSVPQESVTRIVADVGKSQPQRGDNSATTFIEKHLNTEVAESPEDPLEWEDSENEQGLADEPIVGLERHTTRTSEGPMRSPSQPYEDTIPKALQPVITDEQVQEARSASPEFGDVPMEGDGTLSIVGAPDGSLQDNNDQGGVVPLSGLAEEATLEELDEDGALYSDPEDEALFLQLAEEAEEHARFASTFNNKPQEENARDYERELKQLRNQQKKDRRDADEVTQTMITECQQLLSLFGIPYITAPMEAEAQCATLVQLNLVDGIVTDDSDIFLFGGNRVYKNMFNQAKTVECYLAPDLVEELGLDRKKLIAVAQLLGSDYTEGLPGIGPVTALEILSEFGDLETFSRWWAEVQQGTLPVSTEVANFRRKFRRSHGTKLFLPPAFPDVRVETAYLKPEVDHDSTDFAWGVPDLDALRNFLMATIGWSLERTDEVLVPVIKDMNQRESEGTQANITAFFSGSVGAGGFAPRRRDATTSKRLVNALGKMRDRARDDTGPNGGAEQTGERTHQESEASTSGKKVSKRKTKRTKASSPSPSNPTSDDDLYAQPTRKGKGKSHIKKKSKTKA